MNEPFTILIAEDDDGHATLIQRNLKRAGLLNPIQHYKDGQEILDFFFRKREDRGFNPADRYLLLLDIHMPKVDGVDVLRKLKEDDEFRHVPIIMLTTTDDPRDVNLCHQLGCSFYIVKPLKFDIFMDTIRQLGLFLSVVKIPPSPPQK